jgi:hypothetical protein
MRPISTTARRSCDNIKASGITIYSIQVNTASDLQSAVLADCLGVVQPLLPDLGEPGAVDLLDDQHQIVEAAHLEITAALPRHEKKPVLQDRAFLFEASPMLS